MSVPDTWLDTEKYDSAEKLFLESVLGKAEAELSMNAQVSRAAYDAGFEAGVLASEAGVGRADD